MAGFNQGTFAGDVGMVTSSLAFSFSSHHDLGIAVGQVDDHQRNGAPHGEDVEPGNVLCHIARGGVHVIAVIVFLI